MAITTFAAIYIGSYEVSLKIFELSGKKYLLCRPNTFSEKTYSQSNEKKQLRKLISVIVKRLLNSRKQ